MVEDKIDAIDMPDQPERYIKRGNNGVENGEYESFLSFIVCPQKYYDNNAAAHEYPNLLTYEEIRKYPSDFDSQLYYTYLQQIDQAIDKAQRPPQTTLDEKANAFYRKYMDYQIEHYPSLDLRTKRESNGYWAHYATRLGSVYLYHKIQNGNVDLTFSNTASRIDEMKLIAEWLRKHNVSSARAVVTGKAGAIRIDVPKLDMTAPFEQSGIDDIEQCFTAIAELVDAANIFALGGCLADGSV